MKFSNFVVLAGGLALCSQSFADENASWYSNWLDRVTEIQSEQPHWVTPLSTVTPRLEQEFRTDFVGEQTPAGHNFYNFGNGNDGNSQNFVTPEVMFGRFTLRDRLGVTFGGGYQIATTHFTAYNHAWIVSARMPF